MDKSTNPETFCKTETCDAPLMYVDPAGEFCSKGHWNSIDIPRPTSQPVDRLS